MSLLRINELEAQLQRRDERIAGLDAQLEARKSDNKTELPTAAWLKAVLDACMVTEACYIEADPESSVRNLIDWHAANEHHHAAQCLQQSAEDAARWRTFISLPYEIRAEWACNLSLATVLTQWVDQCTIDAAAQKGQTNDQ